MSGSQQFFLGGSAGGYQIERSLRFNSADSAYLNRTPASASNRKTWTWSGWVKRSAFGANYGMFIGTSGNSTGGFDNGTSIRFDSGNSIEIYDYTNSAYNFRLVTTALYRDPSAWYHVVVGFDTTQATASNRVKLYVNGVQVTVFSTSTYPNQNTDWSVNNAIEHLLGAEKTDTTINGYFNGYLTEINFIDGQALTPSSFGQSNPNTGVWEPIRYIGTYGTNGFYLNFSDNSNTTAATLGKDSSGNGNNWTPNNFSVTAGAGNDSLVDTPTSYGVDTGVGGEVRGNYCTLNPLLFRYSVGAGTLRNGNLEATGTSTYFYSTFQMPATGKWYFEGTPTAGTSTATIGLSGLETASGNLTNYVNYLSTGSKDVNNSTTSYGSSYTTNDVIGVAVDCDGGTITFYKNNVSQGAITTTVTNRFVYLTTGGSWTWVMNFGQRPFAYTAPSGFKALCTQNLPTPTIGATSTTQANKYFDATLYTGTGSSRSVTGYNFQPEFVWIKGRSGATDHGLYDAVRGVQLDLVSNSTAAETTQSTGLTAFNSDGFTVGSLAKLNTNTATYVAWAWDAADSNSTNTSGTITSTVRANTTAGFSIVTWTGGTSGGATIGHGLGVTPAMIILRQRDGVTQWWVWHQSLSNTAQSFIQLNNTNAAGANTSAWDNTAPTSTVFSQLNGYILSSGGLGIAYCFAAVAGYSAFGSYTGNGSTDGPFVYTGFRPRFVLLKSSSLAGSFWNIVDTSRSPDNIISTQLYPNSSAAEGTVAVIDALSNGFKIRTTNTDYNSNTNTYIYAAFAESPFKYSLAR